VLCQAVDSRYSVFAKVGLGDLLMIPHGTLNFWTYRNKIDRKHADFVLCAPDDLAPLLVIELDDSSHDRLERRERDFFVDAALDVAGLPILRVPAQHAYAPAEICALINDRMNTDMREVARAC
jgi:very-short-patch-repair endonuclease